MTVNLTATGGNLELLAGIDEQTSAAAHPALPGARPAGIDSEDSSQVLRGYN